MKMWMQFNVMPRTIVIIVKFIHCISNTNDLIVLTATSTTIADFVQPVVSPNRSPVTEPSLVCVISATLDLLRGIAIIFLALWFDDLIVNQL